ncbi:hypothetical protein [Streptomyces rishiriensis]|nr:hypothetical protein [Streptomyces rishiriensis]
MTIAVIARHRGHRGAVAAAPGVAAASSLLGRPARWRDRGT